MNGLQEAKEILYNRKIIQPDIVLTDELPFSDAEPGDTVLFGHYEQDNRRDNGTEEIEWIVLEKNEDKLFIVSKYALDLQIVNKTWELLTWESCDLREWMNRDFIQASFTEKESAHILETVIPETCNPRFQTQTCKQTRDKVFLLSSEEVAKYFPEDSDRVCDPTPYAINKGVYAGSRGGCVWWLRTPGERYSYTMVIKRDGTLWEHGYYNIGSRTTKPATGIRPALWLDLNIEITESEACRNDVKRQYS